MNSFSIMPYEHQSIIASYQQWLVDDLYQNNYFDDINDPSFLQKLSILQADGIRHDIGVHAAVAHGSMQEASLQVREKIQSATTLITSSLDDGFLLMNTHLLEANNSLLSIDQGVGSVNKTLQQGNQILSNIDGGIAQMNHGINTVVSGVDRLDRHIVAGFTAIGGGIAQMNRGINAMVSGVNRLDSHVVAGFSALNSNISQVASVLQYQMQQSKVVLEQILDELRIPESQRERRYHIEEGMKYFNKAMKSGDCLYFDDALDEFTKAVAIERKDFFSWYYTGMIYLYSKEHIDLEKALSAFERYIHYADALPQRHNLFDEAIMMKAECKYLMQEVDTAYCLVEKLMKNNEKAALRGMKYLSASTDSNKQQQAVEILKNLMQKNPYIVMQILEDYDLLSNIYITEYLSRFKTELLKEINQNISSLNMDLELIKKHGFPLDKEIVDELNNLKTRAVSVEKDLGVVDAIVLKGKLLMMSEKISPSISIAEKMEQAISRAEKIEQGFVDLGLPSGTLWKVKNENGFFTYDEAVSRFGSKLPGKEMFEELKSECKWEWNGVGYKVTGPKGNSIVLLASGCRLCDGSVDFVGSRGFYWSSTPGDYEPAWDLYFSSGGVYVCQDHRCSGHSVRLVQD